MPTYALCMPSNSNHAGGTHSKIHFSIKFSANIFSSTNIVSSNFPTTTGIIKSPICSHHRHLETGKCKPGHIVWLVHLQRLDTNVHFQHYSIIIMKWSHKQGKKRNSNRKMNMKSFTNVLNSLHYLFHESNNRWIKVKNVYQSRA